MKKDGENFFIN